MNDYDENLAVNPFYRALQSHHEVLLQAAAQENWVICVPRAGFFFNNAEFSTDFVLRHILVDHHDISAHHYTNLLGNNVIVDGRQVVLVGRNQRGKKNAKILFEEVFYRTDLQSRFKVWCLDRPIYCEDSLGSDPEEMAEPIQYHRIESFVDAEKFLDSEFVKSKFVLQRVQKVCEGFVASKRHIPTLEVLHSNTKLLLNKIWTVLLSSNFYVKKVAKEDSNYSRMLRLAVENYATSHVSAFLIDQIKVLESEKAERLNKKIVNLHYERRAKAQDEVVLVVAERLRQMEERKTVYEKQSLLRDILKGLSSKSSDGILEILVEALLAGKWMDWHPTVVFLRRFQFTEPDNDSSETGYLVTTLEAALQCILEEKLLNEAPRVLLEDTHKVPEIPVFQSKKEFLEYLFQNIESRNEETVLELVNLLTSTEDLRQKLVSKNLCHPLCDCAKCQLKILAETPTIGSQDEKTGCTCVHLVAKYGLVNVMRRILAEKEGNYHRLKNKQGETPLHVAAKHGQQNILLLLLHHDQGLNLNLVDLRGNSVLHLAAKMGHLNCVKALLFFAEHKQLRALQVSGRNYAGDTSLHLAARAGFKGIVETLLEFTAVRGLKNNLGKTAGEVAFSSGIRRLIKDDAWERVVGNHTLKGSAEHRLEPRQVEMVIKAIGAGDVNLALHLLGIKCYKEGEEEEDLMNDLDAEDRVNSCTAEGVTPIHVAMKYNDLNMVRALVKYRVDFGVKTKQTKETPFHWAALGEGRHVTGDPEKDLQAIRYVFENVPNLDAILNEQDSEGSTVIHVAVREGNVRLIHMLLKFQINFQLTDARGKTAIQLARERGMDDVGDYLEYMRFHAQEETSGVGNLEEELEEAAAATDDVSSRESSSASSQSR